MSASLSKSTFSFAEIKPLFCEYLMLIGSRARHWLGFPKIDIFICSFQHRATITPTLNFTENGSFRRNTMSIIPFPNVSFDFSFNFRWSYKVSSNFSKFVEVVIQPDSGDWWHHDCTLEPCVIYLALWPHYFIVAMKSMLRNLLFLVVINQYNSTCNSLCVEKAL